MRILRQSLAAILLLMSFGFARANDATQALAAYTASLRENFPDVPVITTAELADLAPEEAPILLDVRTKKEFDVSHLAGSHRAEEDAVSQLGRLSASSDSSIVVYCSVGYRSALLARKLRDAGFVQVRNLEGSIFAWANGGHPLVNASGATSGAHPFNILWGRYLDKSKWRWEPETQP